MDEIAVLIPCYNEEKTIEKVIRDFKEELPNSKIYVFDNNSTDNSVYIAKKAGAIVMYEKRQGKGNVVRSMFRKVEAKCYIMVDADDTYSVKCAKEMCHYILEEEYDMVIGDRLSSSYFEENKRLFHSFGNKLVRYLINFMFKSNVKDIMTGYRAFSYNFVKTFPVLCKGFEIETEMTLHSLDKNLAIKNVTVDYKDRISGSVSKLNTYLDGFKVIKTIFHLFKNFRPLKFFIFISFVLFLISVYFLVPVLIEYTKTGMVPKFPSFIASGIFIIASLQALFSGLILDNIAQKNKFDFELAYTYFNSIYNSTKNEKKITNIPLNKAEKQLKRTKTFI